MTKRTYDLSCLTAGVLAAWLLLLPVRTHSADVSGASARTSPDWLRSAVVYQVFPRNFSSEGTFNAIAERLDEIRGLGVDIVWLMPIHPIGEKNKKGTIGSPYAVRDYLAVNPRYGTMDDFKHLVREAHRRELKVMIDIVINHTAWDSVLMEHPSWYKQNANGEIISPNEGWIDVAGLNYNNPELRRYMIDMLKFWVREGGVDGFRCDVASMVPTDFWEEARAELERVKPDVVMLAEASEPELLVKAFDLDYSWPLHAVLNDVILHDAPAWRFQESWADSRRRFPEGAIHLRFSDNHDEARAVSRFGIRGALAAQVLMLTLDGVPLFYNGMEVGDATESGDPALFEKLPVFWAPKERPPFRALYRELVQLRKRYPAFQNDRVLWLRNTAAEDVVTIMRLDEHDEFVVAINFSSRPRHASVEVLSPETFKLIRFASIEESTSPDFPTLDLKGYEWRVFHRSVP